MSRQLKDEQQPLLVPQQSSKRVSINVPGEPLSPQVESPKQTKPSEPKQSYTGGIAVMLFITFLSSVCFSIVLPSIWPFLESMHSSQDVVGWAVAVNSIGSFLSSPLFGAWADRRSSREVLAISLVVMIIGNILYSLSTNIWMLLTGRFVVGIAAGNYAVAQTYLSYATSQDNRTMVMALNSAATVLGFIIGPAFALGMAYINFSFKGIEVNPYTCPGYFSAIMSIIGLLALALLKEISPSQKKKGTRSLSASAASYGSGFYSGQGSVKDVSQILKMAKSNSIPWIPVSVCLFAYFTYTASFTVFETIGTPYTARAYDWGVRANSLLYMVLGVICVLSLGVLQVFVKFFTDRILLLIFTAVFVGGFSCFINFPSQYIPLWRFGIGVTLNAISYSSAVAILISIYSKVLEGLDQGAMMGWLSSSGSVARIIGPVIASYCLEYGGPRLVFFLMDGLVLLCFFVLLASYKILIPRVVTEKHVKTKQINANEDA